MKLAKLLLSAALFLGIVTDAWAQASPMVSIKLFGAKCDGTTDDTTAIQTAVGSSGAPTGSMIFFPPGATCLISSTITISRNLSFYMVGRGPVTDSEAPDAYIIKKSTMTTNGVAISRNGFRWYGGGVIGQTGNTGNCIAVLANNVTLDNVIGAKCTVGIRVGTDAGVNANTFNFNFVHATGNISHGIYIHDSGGNANGGTILSPWTQSNGGDGLAFGTASGNTVIGGLGEFNTGYCMHFLTGAAANMIFGGDWQESCNNNNTGPQLAFDAGSAQNMVFAAAVANVANPTWIDNGTAHTNIVQELQGNAGYSCTPGLQFAGSSTGITYGGRVCNYHIVGRRIVGTLSITLTNKGAQVGAAQITGLPKASYDAAGTLNFPVNVGIFSNMAGLTGAMSGYVALAGTVIALQQNGAANTANLTDANFTNTSTIQLSFNYPF